MGKNYDQNRMEQLEAYIDFLEARMKEIEDRVEYLEQKMTFFEKQTTLKQNHLQGKNKRMSFLLIKRK
ncbi:MAG: hypothetical protein H0Z32_02960 [Bacillaceae bacterium]|nr:hypothetical protein [Bacillaceae bacterium]